jgi:ABC-type thiamin/hydroxymethylpyrimidine transport system permease subunit
MLNHPYLPRVTDHFSEGGKQYLVMDFVEGQSLAQLLQQASAPLDVEQVLTWAKQLCDVLHYLHLQQPPIIFRDLKPANIMLEQDGTIKLIDFGIARIFKSGKTTDTTYFGTTGYAPPEQYGGKGQTDARSDIYALGACLHQLLTGHDPSLSPFKFSTVRSLNPNVPQPIDQAIMRALEFGADQRWQSAQEMRDALMASGRLGTSPQYPPRLGGTEGGRRGGEGTSKPSEPIIPPEEPIERDTVDVEAEVEAKLVPSEPPKPTRASNRAFIAIVVVSAGISAGVGIALSERNNDLIIVTLALWFMVGPLAYMLTRRPGAAFFAYSLNLLPLVLLTPGPTTSAGELLALIMPGVVMEGVLAFGGYDNRRYWAVVLASVLAMLALIMAFWLMASTSPASSELALFILGAIVSGFIIGSIAYGIGRVLRK